MSGRYSVPCKPNWLEVSYKYLKGGASVAESVTTASTCKQRARQPLQAWLPITPNPPALPPLPVQIWLPITPTPHHAACLSRHGSQLRPPIPPPCRLPLQTWLPTSECWLPVLHNDRTGIPSEQIIRLGAVVCQVKYYVVALPEALPGESLALPCWLLSAGCPFVCLSSPYCARTCDIPLMYGT